MTYSDGAAATGKAHSPCELLGVAAAPCSSAIYIGSEQDELCMTVAAETTESLFHPNNAAFLSKVQAFMAGLTEVVRASVDPDLVVATHFGVTPSVLKRWVLASGRRHCAGERPRGGACQRPIKQKSFLDPGVWVAAPEAFCSLHKPAQ